MHEPCYFSKFLKIFMEIVQSLGNLFPFRKKESKHNCGVLIKHYAPEQHNHCGSICILHCFVRPALFILSESQKKKGLLGVPLQEPKTIKELKSMLKVFAQGYGQVSLFTI